MTLLLSRTLSTASSTLAKTSEQSLRAQEAMRFVRLVKYDIQGSSDLYVFGSNAPTSTDLKYMCSPLRAVSNTSASWNAISSTSSSTVQGIRPLFSVLVRDFANGSGGYDRDSETAPGGWLSTVNAWVGYEVREPANSTSSTPFQLWRVVCADLAGAPNPIEQNSEFVMNLGTNIEAQVSGQSVVACPSPDGTFAACPLQSSTSSTPWYSISLPFSNQTQALGRDVANQLNVVTRMVGK